MFLAEATAEHTRQAQVGQIVLKLAQGRQAIATSINATMWLFYPQCSGEGPCEVMEGAELPAAARAALSAPAETGKWHAEVCHQRSVLQHNK